MGQVGPWMLAGRVARWGEDSAGHPCLEEVALASVSTAGCLAMPGHLSGSRATAKVEGAGPAGNSGLPPPQSSKWLLTALAGSWGAAGPGPRVASTALSPRAPTSPTSVVASRGAGQAESRGPALRLRGGLAWCPGARSGPGLGLGTLGSLCSHPFPAGLSHLDAPMRAWRPPHPHLARAGPRSSLRPPCRARPPARDPDLGSEPSSLASQAQSWTPKPWLGLKSPVESQKPSEPAQD